ncbi:hypothetical protein KP001_08070 [Geomonas subterranea]|uniref:Methyl-accepting chemotaxis protein n=2 Tax=Geomonas subterranea TaxID=2847989 RepID=A0ABX8LQE9_9BACT|nr:hypothetical protein [Geomonas subterranea]QXE92468.1 hypothetical protein KP001_08070 [Geomonas subterranea]
MELRARLTAISTLFLASVIFLSGYATTGMQRSATTTSKVQTVQGDVQQAVMQVNTSAEVEA